LLLDITYEEKIPAASDPIVQNSANENVVNE